jgi:glycosyltransferase involved in cell wall biosynthesis
MDDEMRIGYDITSLYIARAGILYYNVNLLRQLVAVSSTEEIVLVDYAPVRQDLPLIIDISDLPSERVYWKVIEGPRIRKAIRWQRMNFTGGRFIAQQVDALLEGPWQWWIEYKTRLSQQDVLSNLDVFHVSDVTQLAPKKSRLVATIYDLSPVIFPQFHTSENRNLFARKLEHVRQHADTLIAISENTKRDIVHYLGFPEDRIHVAYGGVDESFAPFPNPRQLQVVLDKYGIREPGYILHVGTLEPRKNLVRLIEAYASVRLRCGDSTPPLVLVGHNGWDSDGIFAAVQRCNIAEHTQIIGFVADTDLPTLYNGACIFAYPSLYEGFGIPVLEAMACGVPVLTSNVSSLPEIVGDAGVLVEAGDTQSIANGLQLLLEETEFRQDLGERGLQRAKQFSWRATALATLNAYRTAYQ